MEENAYQSPIGVGYQGRSTAGTSCRVVFGWAVICAATSFVLWFALCLIAQIVFPTEPDEKTAIVFAWTLIVSFWAFPVCLLVALVSGALGVCGRIARTMTPRERKIVAVTLANACILAMFVDGATWLFTGEHSVPIMITIGLLMPIGGYFLWSWWRAVVALRRSQGDYPVGKRDRDVDFP